MIETFSTAKKKEKAVLVALINQSQPEYKVEEYLDELAFLAETSGAITKKKFTQKLDKPDVTYFVGKGKLDEIKTYVQANEIDMVIFDDDLSPSQVRNLENKLKCKILDRSLLILNIFSIRAKTAQAKAQVELAQYQYLLPRLTKMWTHLSKQKGGIGMRGPGEKELETDRRIVRDKIALFNKKLEKIDKQNATRRKARQQVVRVALVGYTNVGKSTLMRLLSKSDVFAENKLFATVDSTVRKVVIGRIPFLLTDTVGFIRKLPHALIECFKSTLDEIREADVLLHVVDAFHPSFEEQISVVKNTLTEIGVSDKPALLVFNKVDKLMKEADLADDNGHDLAENGLVTEDVEIDYHPPLTLEQLEATYMGNGNEDAIFISAVDRLNIDKLRKSIYDKVADKYFTIYPNYVQNGMYY
ncbi:GTP-binding protein HflX [Catalinimonas alkaloidigena]|uniref:GTPase HflX n=1 Tax=Catalinimonas alkaloidigena TaxID=1075417 RepID=UPI00240682DD|nr:GTPase HflX [Catalinimonas alkaloidigena]MDF9799797.1 GTP-binding protein HflX [Catalinimonas alkaloidigena]